MDWFRSYHGAPSDSKLSLIAKDSGKARAFVTAVWWEVLDHASRNVTQRGDVSRIDHEIIAIQQGMEPEEVASIMSAMAQRGIIKDGIVANWEKRQVRREDDQATERKRKSRDRRRAESREVPHTSRNVTQCHAPDTEERREEKKEGAAAPLPDWLPSAEWRSFKQMRVKIKAAMTPDGEGLGYPQAGRASRARPPPQEGARAIDLQLLERPLRDQARERPYT